MGLRIKITIWEKVSDGSCKERKMRNEFNNLILYVLITSIISVYVYNDKNYSYIELA